MATNFSEFLAGVLPSVPACPRTTVINAIRDAARRLCKDSLTLRQTLTAIDTVIGDDVYGLVAPANTEIVTITYAEYNGIPINVQSPEWLDANDYNWRNAGEGAATVCFLLSPTKIQLNRKSKEVITGGLVVEVALKPSFDAADCDDSLYVENKECIERGAKHYLMEIPKKEWTDLPLSAHHGKHFNYLIQDHTAFVRRGRTRGVVRAPMRFFA